MKVSFFGEEASVPSGTVRLALRTGAAIVPIFSVRKSSDRFAIYIEPPIELVDTGNRIQSARANLEKLVSTNCDKQLLFQRTTHGLSIRKECVPARRRFYQN